MPVIQVNHFKQCTHICVSWVYTGLGCGGCRRVRHLKIRTRAFAFKSVERSSTWDTEDQSKQGGVFGLPSAVVMCEAIGEVVKTLNFYGSNYGCSIWNVEKMVSKLLEEHCNHNWTYWYSNFCGTSVKCWVSSIRCGWWTTLFMSFSTHK